MIATSTIFRSNGGNYVAIVNGKRIEGGRLEVEDAVAAANGTVSRHRSTQEKQAKCPRCGRYGSVLRIVDFFHCTACDAEFDDLPDEGGDYFTDPTKRIERKHAKGKHAN
jgi:ribosomal protein L37AE/L43A